MEGPDEIKKLLKTMVLSFYQKKSTHFGKELTDRAEQIIILHSIDSHWRDHIDAMAHLREQVAFSGYAQRDPLIEYQDQGFRMFEKLLAAISSTTVRTILQIDFAQFASPPPMTKEEKQLQTNADEIESQLTHASLGPPPMRVGVPRSSSPVQASKVGRNDPCPCGSGKKYKKCHGAGE